LATRAGSQKIIQGIDITPLSSSCLNVNNWINKLEDMFCILNIPEEKKYPIALTLVDTSKFELVVEYIGSRNITEPCLIDFKNAVNAFLIKPLSTNVAVDEIMEMRQQHYEEFSSYAKRIKQAVLNAFPEDWMYYTRCNIEKKVFISGIYNHEIRNKIMMTNPSSMDEAAEIAIKLSGIKSEDKIRLQENNYNVAGKKNNMLPEKYCSISAGDKYKLQENSGRIATVMNEELQEDSFRIAAI
jgi:hypothetical protein